MGGFCCLKNSTWSPVSFKPAEGISTPGKVPPPGVAEVSVAHFLLILSLNYAEASKLAPLSYSEIIMNVIIGYYFFGDFPNQWIWIGLIIIIASGVYISLRENKKIIF